MKLLIKATCAGGYDARVIHILRVCFNSDCVTCCKFLFYLITCEPITQEDPHILDMDYFPVLGCFQEPFCQL